MEKIAALRLFVPLTVVLLCIMVLVPYILQETVHSGHDAGHKRSLFSRRQDNQPGDSCPDQHGHRCGPHMICQINQCKIQAGQQCTQGTQTCVNGAQCRQPTTTAGPSNSGDAGPDSSVCLCDEGHYHNTTNHTCEQRIPLGGDCESQEHGHSPCVEPDKTVCHNNTCQCHEDYASTNNTTCTPRFLVGESGCTDYTHHNPQDNDCVENANCDHNKCVCTSEYYQSNTKHCEKRIAPGQSCDNANASHDETTPCKDGASCHGGICECDPYFHKQIDSGADATCLELKKVGGTCQSPDDCVPNTQCSDHQPSGKVCVCDPEYFHNVSILLCEHKKPAMIQCGESVECVDDAHCVGGICVCDEHFYNHQQRCNTKLSMGHVCDDQVPGQCLINGECFHGHCRCNDKSFDNEGANCPLTLKVGDACNWYNHDSRQCQSNTTCVFRPSDNNPMCGCDIDHFFNSEYCVTRAFAGDPCPYAAKTSMGLKMEDDEFHKQCVENAECETTYNVCHCTSDRYNRAGRCPLKIAVNGYCDPWTDNIDQCASNAQCLYGRCVGVTAGPVIG